MNLRKTPISMNLMTTLPACQRATESTGRSEKGKLKIALDGKTKISGCPYCLCA